MTSGQSIISPFIVRPRSSKCPAVRFDDLRSISHDDNKLSSVPDFIQAAAWSDRGHCSTHRSDERFLGKSSIGHALWRHYPRTTITRFRRGLPSWPADQPPPLSVYLSALLRSGTFAGLSDGELLERFASGATTNVTSRRSWPSPHSWHGTARWSCGSAARCSPTGTRPRTPFKRLSWSWQRGRVRSGGVIRSGRGCTEWRCAWRPVHDRERHEGGDMSGGVPR